MTFNSTWPSRYVGVPFRGGGRDICGLDCWGLVRLVYLNECGIELLPYGEVSANNLRAIAASAADGLINGPWRAVPEREKYRVYDIAVMGSRIEGGSRVETHCGVMIDADRLLHVEKATATVIVPLTHPTVRHRLLSVYRHHDLSGRYI